MSEIQSYLFDFTEVDDFFDNWNVKFSTTDMDGSNKFQLVLASYSPTNISECLNANGTLNTTNVTGTRVLDCGLIWNNRTIKLAFDVDFNIGNSIVPLKAVFLRHKSTGYVMGYSININSFNITNHLIYDADSIFYSIAKGDING